MESSEIIIIIIVIAVIIISVFINFSSKSPDKPTPKKPLSNPIIETPIESLEPSIEEIPHDILVNKSDELNVKSILKSRQSKSKKRKRVIFSNYNNKRYIDKETGDFLYDEKKELT